MEELIQEQSGETVIPPLLDKAWKRVLFGLLVVAAPIFNFSYVELLKPDWQDGNFSSYINLFLLPQASLWFFPLLAYAVISYILLLWGSERFARSFIVRLGIYGGTLLALQYSILTILALEGTLFFIVILGFLSPLILKNIYRWSISKWEVALIKRLFLAFGIIILTASMILTRNLFGSFFFIVLFLGISTPFWSFLIALQASRWLWTYHEIKLTLSRGLGIFAWLSAYVYALRFNILKMYELYNVLPIAPPNCYIATAAAKGHPRIVGSRKVMLANGKAMRVNRQLRRLKAVEITLMGVSSTGHRMMRRIYDVIGKRLAATIQNPILADIAFLLLVPVEWVSFLVLQLLIPELDNFSERLYLS